MDSASSGAPDETGLVLETVEEEVLVFPEWFFQRARSHRELVNPAQRVLNDL